MCSRYASSAHLTMVHYLWNNRQHIGMIEAEMSVRLYFQQRIRKLITQFSLTCLMKNLLSHSEVPPSEVTPYSQIAHLMTNNVRML